MKFFAILIIIGMSLISGFSQASLINNTNTFTDTDTGYEWLKLSNTLNYSYEDIITNQLSLGGDFEGWTLAKRSDLFELFTSVGWSTRDSGGNQTIFAPSIVNALQPLFGKTHVALDNTWMHYEDESSWGNTSGMRLSGNYVIFNRNDFSVASDSYDFVGVALYRVATTEHELVSEPSTLVIFALGLIGLVSRRFKKQ